VSDARPSECWKVIGVYGDASCPELVPHTHCRNCPVYADAGRALFERPHPEGYLAEWTARLAPEKRATAASTSMLVFRVGTEWLGIATSSVVEVCEPRPIVRVPHRSPRRLAGLVSIRGEVQLCVSLHGLLEVEASGPQQKRRIVLLSEGRGAAAHGADGLWATPVDEVSGIADLAPADLSAAPKTITTALEGIVRGFFSVGGHTVGALDPARLFDRTKGFAE
jgi:chemotaxis-related protein WspD